MAITWKSRRDLHLNSLYFVNALMRKAGMVQPVPGRRPLWDRTKVGAYSAARAIVNPLRRSEGMRRRLRSLFFGRKANYFYREKTGG